MNALDQHLEQISLSAAAIAELPFPRPRAFTNALLEPHDITSLIRDTEAHERALFSVKPSASSRSRSRSRSRSINPRRATLLTEDINNPAVTGTGTGTSDPSHPNYQDSSMVGRIYAATSNQRRSAVAHVLGNDMMGEIKRSTAAAAMSGSSIAKAKGEVDIELLLRGAKMLCEAYPIAGAREQISHLRARYKSLSASVDELESTVAQQSEELEQLRYRQDNHDDGGIVDDADSADGARIPDEEFEKNHEEIQALEAKKKMLEEKLCGIDDDLGEMMG